MVEAKEETVVERRTEVLEVSCASRGCCWLNERDVEADSQPPDLLLVYRWDFTSDLVFYRLSRTLVSN